MSDVAIRVEGLGKRYRIGKRERYRALRDVLTDAVHAQLRGIRSTFQRSDVRRGNGDRTIWALKDVTFEVKQGEVVGIIGRNGAGKSTLLKILSRITEPTSGMVDVFGRVGSLLEVGTGFHPELTGRENIYLNGAILGMKRAEIGRKFDEIVAFAEIDKFLDTPVKHYSSGMYVRLAFAVAAQLEPEILLVDEVLTVGDTAFQKKCLGKMGEVAKQGRTVLFVSHNMAAVEHLCQRGVILDHGALSYFGDVEQAVGLHIAAADSSKNIDLSSRKDRKGNQFLRFTRVVLCDVQGNELTQVLSGRDILVRCYYAASSRLHNAKVNVALGVVYRGRILINMNSYNSSNGLLDIYENGFFECSWKNFNLTAGSYDCVMFCAINGEVADWVDSALTLDVENGDFFGGGNFEYNGTVLVPHSWISCMAEQ